MGDEVNIHVVPSLDRYHSSSSGIVSKCGFLFLPMASGGKVQVNNAVLVLVAKGFLIHRTTCKSQLKSASGKKGDQRTVCP